MRHTSWLAWIVMTMLPSSPWKRSPLSVHGHVYTTDGQPIRYASVKALPLNQPFGGWGPDVTRTDQFGAYKLDLTYKGPESILAETQVFPLPNPQLLTFNVHRKPVTSQGFTPGQSSNELDFYLPRQLLDKNYRDRQPSHDVLEVPDSPMPPPTQHPPPSIVTFQLTDSLANDRPSTSPLTPARTWSPAITP